MITVLFAFAALTFVAVLVQYCFFATQKKEKSVVAPLAAPAKH